MKVKDERCIANCSMGKDSIAMVLLLIDNGLRLDEVSFYETGAEYDSMIRNRDKLAELLDKEGIKFNVYKPPHTIIEYMTTVKINTKHGERTGKGWCGRPLQYGAGLKRDMLLKGNRNADKIYLGFAYDEMKRIAKITEDNYCCPLYDFKMTEKDALDYCHAHGFNWF